VAVIIVFSTVCVMVMIGLLAEQRTIDETSNARKGKAKTFSPRVEMSF